MELRGCYPHILEAFDGGDLEESYALEKIVLKRRASMPTTTAGPRATSRTTSC